MKKIFLLILIIFYLCMPANNFVKAEALTTPDLQSESAILVDSETGAVLFEKNAEQKMFPASLTKIATAIYSIENGELEDTVTVSEAAANADGTSVFLEEEEQVPLKKLIQGMLINSGNDAAAAIAEHLDGNQFEEQINQYLTTKVHVKDTHFTNPHGLFDENHYTTAKDLAQITNYALKNEIFREIYGTKELKWIGKSWDTTLLTHHRMLKGEIPYEAVNGGKTGYVQESQFTLATTAIRDKMQLTVIVLKGANDKEVYEDTKRLLDYGFEQFKHSYISKSDIFQTEGRTYTTDERDVMITIPTSSYQKHLTSNGQLRLTSQNGDLIQSVSLVEKKENKKETADRIIDQANNETMGYYGKYAMVLLIIGVLFIGLQKLKKR
ncbi:D-alanyl-D-alanine carboxypeptidase family protein [Bacillus sp. DTU_2020_1000418_1_SI_GHA_SEK_038]|uniref:D-alanyl-D-alanine carboxypeptidase family protein n=1 Tax=Bacillus sp. DTU_2020_1000418_1_SI_GHA_SEK_038 TaxID=3077585 RepID=UPI0028ECEFA6|nr:D-alanyl-D-alanine carboxypeptidase family protein [Bacillus sp. DTU_2020_1000418_1_SI_GHA_SEK_038]WNS73508.1 D-alanyl-D-alanine carboxypeptidase family protein [Bacillus sp. DTU_2020_1000418_1_SI_GHA_SEK_038]